MILEHSSKNKIALLVIPIIILILGIFVFFYSPVIFQEGNPWPQIKGIVQLTFGKSDMVKLSGSDNTYLTKSQNGPMAVEAFMKGRGYEYTDQMGSGYFYKSSDRAIVLTRRQYSRSYVIWTITENNDSEPDNDLWTTITNDQDITFQYPKELLAKYVSVVDWPPLIKMETGTYSCETTPQELSSMSDITSERLVDNRTYCVNIKNEGAAGSVYSSYTYTTAKGGKLVKVSFTLQYPDCNNYDEKQRNDCTSEREAFDIDSIVDRIIQAIKIK